jgi:hypothetical protein
VSTARDRIEAQRAGFVAGIRAVNSGRWTPAKQKAADDLAVRTYPTPTYERPRTVTVPSLHDSKWDTEYKVEGGKLFSRCLGHPYYNSRNDPRQWKASAQTPDSLRALLDLFDNPTETVEVQ